MSIPTTIQLKFTDPLHYEGGDVLRGRCELYGVPFNVTAIGMTYDDDDEIYIARNDPMGEMITLEEYLQPQSDQWNLVEIPGFSGKFVLVITPTETDEDDDD